MDGRGFYGDTFSSGFGDFYTAKRSDIPRDISQYRQLIKVIKDFYTFFLKTFTLDFSDILTELSI